MYHVKPFVLVLTVFIQCQAQHPKGLVSDPAFDKEILSLLNFTIPILSVQQAKDFQDCIYLDAREKEEYTVSHIPNALHIGYDHWNKEILPSIPKDKKLIVYCSVGYRSEKIAEKIKALGYTQVYNLYGSIFEWANMGFNLVDTTENSTHKLHTYNKQWARWVKNDKIEKIY